MFAKNPIISVKDIGRKGKLSFYREAWTFMSQSNLQKKVFIIERLRKESVEGKMEYPDSWKIGDIEYRIGYFIVGSIGKTRGKWLWGQFSPLIPSEDLNSLLSKAKDDGTLIY